MNCRKCHLPLHANNIRRGLDTCATCRHVARMRVRNSIGMRVVREVLEELRKVPRDTSPPVDHGQREVRKIISLTN